jgi:hypothetical protein
MLFNLAYNSLLGILIGNIKGLFIRLFSSEKDNYVWRSEPYLSGLDAKNAIGMLIWVFFTGGMALFFNLAFMQLEMTGLKIDLPFKILVSFFFVTSLLLIIQLPHWFDRIYFYEDRIEIRLVFHTYKVIKVEEVALIARTKSTQSNVDIAYHDKHYGFTSLVGGSKRKIPASIFEDERLKLFTPKVHSNAKTTLQSVKKDLPKDLIKVEKIDFGNDTGRMAILISLLILNPYFLSLVITTIFGIFMFNVWTLLLIDFSKSYFGFGLKQLSKKYEINPELIEA